MPRRWRPCWCCWRLKFTERFHAKLEDFLLSLWQTASLLTRGNCLLNAQTLPNDSCQVSRDPLEGTWLRLAVVWFYPQLADAGAQLWALLLLLLLQVLTLKLSSLRIGAAKELDVFCRRWSVKGFDSQQNTSGFVVYADCCYLLVFIVSLHRTLIHPLAGFHAESARSFLALPYFKLLQFHLRDKVGTTTAPPVVTTKWPKATKSRIWSQGFRLSSEKAFSSSESDGHDCWRTFFFRRQLILFSAGLSQNTLTFMLPVSPPTSNLVWLTLFCFLNEMSDGVLH